MAATAKLTFKLCSQIWIRWERIALLGRHTRVTMSHKGLTICNRGLCVSSGKLLVLSIREKNRETGRPCITQGERKKKQANK